MKNHQVTRGVTVARKLLVLHALGGDPEPTPGPRAIECPTAGRAPSTTLLKAHFSGLLRHQFSDGATTAGFIWLVLAGMQDRPTLKKRSQFARECSRGAAVRLIDAGE